jgi:hypothetical protein
MFSNPNDQCSSGEWPHNKCDQMIIDTKTMIIRTQARLIRNYQQLATIMLSDPHVEPHEEEHAHG